MRFFVFTLLLILISAPAMAQPREVVECGPALTTDMDTRPAYNYCDLYSRQIAYGQKRQDFRAQIDQRRQYNSVPRQRALDAYHAWEDSRYETVENDQNAESYESNTTNGSIEDMSETELSNMLDGELK